MKIILQPSHPPETVKIERHVSEAHGVDRNTIDVEKPDLGKAKSVNIIKTKKSLEVSQTNNKNGKNGSAKDENKV